MIIYGYYPFKPEHRPPPELSWWRAEQQHTAETDLARDIETCPCGLLIHLVDSNCLPDLMAAAAVRELGYRHEEIGEFLRRWGRRAEHGQAT
jgi:hypothetical protein